MLKQVTEVELIQPITEINPVKSLYKRKFYVDVTKDHREIKKLKWEALELVGEANKHLLTHEIKMRKSNKNMTPEEKFRIQEDFFNRYLKNMSDEKADRLSELLEAMVINRAKKIEM